MASLNSYDDIRLRYVAEGYEAVGRFDAAEKVHLWRVQVAPDNASRQGRLGDFYRRMGRLAEAAASYSRAVKLGEDPGQAIKSRMVMLELDRDDVAAADRLVAEIEAAALLLPPRNRRFAQIARLNLDLYRGRFTDSAALAHEVGAGLGDGQYGDWEPVAYFGVLAGQPADSRKIFERVFPALLTDDDPSINGDNLEPAIDLAAVLMRTGEQARADLLLRNGEAFLNSMAEIQRRHQFRTAPMEIYALQGRTADALAALRVVIDSSWRDGWWRLERKPHFESLRANPRFQAMVAELREGVTR
jgi:tetratricopeptide (TPR) repeat protein